MRKVYEAWAEFDGPVWTSISFGAIEGIEEQKAKGLIRPAAKLMYRIEADTFEEALAVHYIKMGWSPFQPAGKPKPCPNSCGAVFYPEGSGESPNCGKIC
jgi:hypothetical protein